MHADIRCLWTHKAGGTLTDYEDAFWPYWGRRSVSGRILRCAVADGATEAAFSRLWARLLVQLYCGADSLPPTVQLTKAQFQGQSRTGQAVVTPRARFWSNKVFRSPAAPLAWNVLAKAQQGSFAALLGLTLTDNLGGKSDSGSWCAFAVGDSCLFHLRDDKLWGSSWPLTDPAQFGVNHRLLATDPAKNAKVWADPSPLSTHGEWRGGDIFLLMTDALAEWFMRGIQAGHAPSKLLPSCQLDHSRFPDWIATLRRQDHLRNDDTTLPHLIITDDR